VAIGEINVEDLAALGEGVRLVDVREPNEWAAGHVPWAVHLPLGQVPDGLDVFDGSPTYVICRSGGRSARACEFAEGHGLHAVNVVGGMLAWVEAGLATASADG
jgi:rhodanese-related sulfurtransferase